MEQIVLDEYEYFLEEIQKENYRYGKYMVDSDYEDEYSHDDIDTMQETFIEKVKEYLHTYYPNKFIVTSGWCVFVMTPDRARESNISESTINSYLVV